MSNIDLISRSLPTSHKASENEQDKSRELVQEYYGKDVKKRSDLKTSACIVPVDEDEGQQTLVGAVCQPLIGQAQLVKNVHKDVLDKFYGCGSPIPPLMKGCTVVDLGCGSGRDAYVAAQLVGESGRVIGVDMTDSQLEVARKFLDWHKEKFGFKSSNVEFRKGMIEDLSSAGIEDNSVDVVISNCVINLCSDKGRVLREVHRVLKEGGEMYFSDVFADRRIKEELKNDKVLLGECLAGALYFSDFRSLMHKSGLGAWGVVTGRELHLERGGEMRRKLGEGVRFFSETVRAVKLPGGEVEEAPEDYGQYAKYLGGIPFQESQFTLDKIREFPKCQVVPVDFTTASMIARSRYHSAFEIGVLKNRVEGKAGDERTVPEKRFLEHQGAFKNWKLPLFSSLGASVDVLESVLGSTKQVPRSCAPSNGNSCC